VPRGTQGQRQEVGSLSSTGLSPFIADLSSVLRLETYFVTPLGCRSNPVVPYNPAFATAATYHATAVWAFPRSLATTRGMISLPRDT
jgi:hypothetical protein